MLYTSLNKCLLAISVVRCVEGGGWVDIACTWVVPIMHNAHVTFTLNKVLSNSISCSHVQAVNVQTVLKCSCLLLKQV